MAGVLVALLAVVVVVAAGAGFAVWFFQDRFLYMPRVPGSISNRDPAENHEPSLRDPANVGLRHETLRFATRTKGVKLHGWLLLADVQPGRGRAPTILFFHGNAGNIGHRLPFAAPLVEKGFNMLLFDYRGYGLSDGWPTEALMIEDAEMVLAQLREHEAVDRDNVWLMGRSLVSCAGARGCSPKANARTHAQGGAVGIALAERVGSQVRGLALENTFLSVPLLVEDMLSDSGLPRHLSSLLVRLFVTLRWESHRRIVQLPPSLPVLFVAGELDEIVPHEHMLRLERLHSESRTGRSTMRQRRSSSSSDSSRRRSSRSSGGGGGGDRTARKSLASAASVVAEVMHRGVGGMRVFRWGDHNYTWCEHRYNETLAEFFEQE